MKIVLIVIMIISAWSVIIPVIIYKKIKSKINDRIYKVIYKLGSNILITIFILSYSYFYTDTLFDYIHVVGLFLLGFIVLGLNHKYFMERKYKWFSFLIVISLIYGCMILASKYMLNGHERHLTSGIIPGITGSQLAAYLKKSGSNYKKMMYITSFVCIITTTVISWYFRTPLFNNSKPIRTTINKAQSEKYDVTGSYFTYVQSWETNRFEPIVISIIGIEDRYGTSCNLKLKYYKGEITEVIVK